MHRGVMHRAEGSTVHLLEHAHAQVPWIHTHLLVRPHSALTFWCALTVPWIHTHVCTCTNGHSTRNIYAHAHTLSGTHPQALQVPAVRHVDLEPVHVPAVKQGPGLQHTSHAVGCESPSAAESYPWRDSHPRHDPTAGEVPKRPFARHSLLPGTCCSHSQLWARSLAASGPVDALVHAGVLTWSDVLVRLLPHAHMSVWSADALQNCKPGSLTIRLQAWVNCWQSSTCSQYHHDHVRKLRTRTCMLARIHRHTSMHRLSPCVRVCSMQR